MSKIVSSLFCFFGYYAAKIRIFFEIFAKKRKKMLLFGQCDAECMGLRLVDGVFFQHARTTGTVAKSEHGAVDREVGMALIL
jgi:hypothetical protein